MNTKKQSKLHNNVINLLNLVRTRTAVTVITLAVTAVLIVIITAVTVNGDNVSRYKYYKSIMIEPGDTLWTIAEQYYDRDESTITDYINEIKTINCISDEHIKSGNYLVISYYR